MLRHPESMAARCNLLLQAEQYGSTIPLDWTTPMNDFVGLRLSVIPTETKELSKDLVMFQ